MLNFDEYEVQGNSYFHINDIINTMNNTYHFNQDRTLNEAADHVIKMATDFLNRDGLKLLTVDPYIFTNPLGSEPLLSFHLWLTTEDNKKYKIWIHYFLYRTKEYDPQKKKEFFDLLYELRFYIAKGLEKYVADV